MSPAQLGKQTGLPTATIDLVLDRLLQLRYVSRKGARYEAEARQRGA
jgi:DNA-binding IclR family transcriptional regulator